MVNKDSLLTTATRLVAGYVLLTIVSVLTLIVLSALGSDEATSDAWGHAVIVAAFSVLLALRLRAARRGSAPGLKAVGIIAVVLLVVNVVEAALPHAFPVWMRVEMLAVAIVMAALVVAVRRALGSTPAAGPQASVR